MKLTVKGKEFDISDATWQKLHNVIPELVYEKPDELPEIALLLGLQILKMQYSKNTVDEYK